MFDTENYQGSSLAIGDYPIHSESVTIGGGAALLAGTIMATDGTTYHPAVVGGDFEQAVGVLAVDVDASGGDVQGPVHLSGKFDEALCTTSLADMDAVRASLRKIGAPVFVVSLV